MKNMLYFCAKIFLTCIVCSLLFFAAYNNDTVNGGSSEKIILCVNDMTNAVRGPLQQKGYKIKQTSTYVYTYNTKNYDDGLMQKAYNKTVCDSEMIPNNSDGTCWATAMTSVLKYYGVKKSAENVYCAVVRQAFFDYGKKVLSKGLQASNVNTLLNKMFTNHYDLKKKATYYSNNGSQPLIDIVKKQYASKGKNIGLFCGDDHAMSCGGYATVDCIYLDKNKKQKQEHGDFFVVSYGIFADKNHQFYSANKKNMNRHFGYIKIV